MVIYQKFSLWQEMSSRSFTVELKSRLISRGMEVGEDEFVDLYHSLPEKPQVDCFKFIKENPTSFERRGGKIKLKTSIELCYDHRFNLSGCALANKCSNLHLCPHFLIGKCDFYAILLKCDSTL